ncbi:MAG TPA: NAD(P)-dependent alcohol dehydrogenase [Gemmatimonadaceae bacterium]|nr:NAD(P)-dependent alcohol dehydrogenase [Gemmatimonadaceae bacterium]
MRAIVYRDFGSPDVLKAEDVEKPTPADNEVLVAVRAASVNMFDWYMVRGKPALLRPALGLGRPKPLGVDLSGVVEAAGRSVTQFKPGDRVFGTGRDKGLRSTRGAFAEYVSATERALAIMPGNVTFEQAAAVPMAGLTALQGLRDHGRMKRGQKVLVNGASGGIGTFAVQIAKAFGANVTGVCSTRNADMVRSIGADHVIDYTSENFTAGATRYDVILDIVGSQPWPACRRVLTDSGKYVLAGGPPSRGLRLMLLSPFTRGKLVTFVTRANPEDLNVLRELIESGAVTPVIDRSYRLEETSDAIGYVAAGHTRGKVVIAIGADSGKSA